MTRVLITTTSFQDTPGEHHRLLEEAGYELVRARGPLPEQEILDLVGDLDGLLCGDDAITRAVLEKAGPRLRVISKYGIGVDKIDVAAATEMGIPVLFTPGVNHTTVAEHALLLLLAMVKNLIPSVEATSSGTWKRMTGNEIHGKSLGIVGLGRIGKEVAIRARAFGMEVMAFDVYWDDAFAQEHGVYRAESLSQLLRESDVVSLHTNLTEETRDLIRSETLAEMKDGVLVVNCARGELVNSEDMAEALRNGKVGGYGTDVLDQEPPPADHPLLLAPRCIVTPHIGSRTYESVVRQATMSVRNLTLALSGEQPLAQVNKVPIRKPGE